MNRRTFLAGTTGAATLATTTLSSSAQARDRKRVLIPDWEPERIADLRAAVPEVELVVAKDSLEQIRDADAAYGFIDAAHQLGHQQDEAADDGVGDPRAPRGRARPDRDVVAGAGISHRSDRDRGALRSCR